MERNNPPYEITNKVLNMSMTIMEKIGRVNYIQDLNRFPELRRKTAIRSIHSSLAIENNQLSLFQVEAVINGKSVIGEQKDIQEVKNAYKAYEEIDNLDPYSIDDLKKIHGILTFAIEEDSGRFRNHGEAVYDGDIPIHIAPPHTIVPTLMNDLFMWMNEVKTQVNPLILSSVFHYELLFIHPFSDGNGRTARLWQTAILTHWKSIFKYIPIESMIKKHQEEYYDTIQRCNKAGNSTSFIEFMLKIIDEAVDGIIIEKEETTQETAQETTQEKLLKLIRKNPNITQAEMAKALNLTRDGVSYNIKILKEKGIIERVGSTKNGIWKINESKKKE